MPIHPAAQVKIETHVLTASGGFPNNPRLPLLVYRGVIRSEGSAAETLEHQFRENGWEGSWRNGVFDYHHFHSNAHEVLGVAEGSAQLQFGGPEGPVVELHWGDVAILPAGTGHKKVEASADFLIVGAYPAGQTDYDLLRGDPEERRAAEQRIAGVLLPMTDPIYGTDGPLREHWGDGR